MTHFNVRTIPAKRLPEACDIVVVGAGMSGLYLTWRLLEEDPSRSICIVERINRTGGRLDSDLIDFGNEVVVKEEQGGMRFTFDTMDDLMSLFLILDLEKQIVPFPMNSGGNNRLYFRGRAFTNAEAADDDYAIWSELYDLNQAERGINPKTIIDTVFNRILAANPSFKERPEPRTPEFWQDFRLECQWNGVALKDWTLWNLLAEMGYSNECITLLYRLLGFNGTFLSEMNAGEAYQLLEDFPADPKFHTLSDGFSALPNALVERIGTDRIYLETTVESLAANDTGQGYVLACSQRSEDGSVTPRRIAARQVVLALPRLALEKVFVRSNAFNELPAATTEQLWNTLHTTTDQALLKINLYYDKAWWGNSLSGQPPVEFGPNFSDLPLGSVYPFYAINEALFADLEYRNWLKQQDLPVPPEFTKKLTEISNSKYNQPAALTIYCDYLNINFWRALQQNGPLFTSPLQEMCNEMDPQTIYAASQAVVNAATRFFKQLFNTQYVPEPVLTSARIWAGTTEIRVPAAEQVGYGVHQWGLHADDREAMTVLVEPIKDIFTCGEAFSDYQGWVEGALRSADLVLDRAFGLKPIAAVYRERHGGREPSFAIRDAYKERSAALIRKYIDPGFTWGEGEPDTPAALDEGFDIKLTYFDR